MDEKTRKALLDTIEAQGWWYNICDDGLIEIGKYSPAGEDFSFDIEGKDIAAEVQQYYEDLTLTNTRKCGSKLWTECGEFRKASAR